MGYSEQPPRISETGPLLFVLSGPSGAGKDAVLTRMKQLRYDLHYTVTVTTRSPRLGEKNGVDYHFVSVGKFWKMVENQELLEWAKVYENYYGVPKKEVQQALESGQDVLVKVDVQGATTIKGILPQAVFIFLTPLSNQELAIRLKQRHTESSAELALRLNRAEEELKSLPLFDYIVVNHPDKIDLAVAQISAIITAEKCRVKPRIVKL
jgi:guanylate kinase